MKLLNFLFIFSLIISAEAGYDFPLKTKLLNKFRSLVCSWLSLDQYNTIAGQLEPVITPETTVDELKSKIISVGMETLNPQQKTTLALFAGKFVAKYGNYEDAMGVLGTVIANNLVPFADQLKAMWYEYEAEGKTKERIFQRGYKMGDMFMTNKRVGTIYCRLKAAFNQYNPTMWPFIRQNMNTMFLFSVLEGLPNSCT